MEMVNCMIYTFLEVFKLSFLQQVILKVHALIFTPRISLEEEQKVTVGNCDVGTE